MRQHAGMSHKPDLGRGEDERKASPPAPTPKQAETDAKDKGETQPSGASPQVAASLPRREIRLRSSAWGRSLAVLAIALAVIAIAGTKTRSSPETTGALADLSFARMSGSVLDGADLDGANMVGAQMSSVSLVGASLESVDFTGACLREAVFGRANLQDAVFKRADLRGADLSTAAIDGADFDLALFDGDTDWPNDAEPEEALRVDSIDPGPCIPGP